MRDNEIFYRVNKEYLDFRTVRVVGERNKVKEEKGNSTILTG